MHLLTRGLLLGRNMQGIPCSATESMSKPRCGLPLLRLRPRRPSACARPGSDTADVRSRWLSLSRLRGGVESLDHVALVPGAAVLPEEVHRGAQLRQHAHHLEQPAPHHIRVAACKSLQASIT